jgi:type II secretory pathway pseudopilin PulG
MMDLIKITRHLRKNGGFTILELVIFSAIFSMIAIVFVSVLISILRVQTRESAAAEVNRQSQFLMQIIQRYVEESSMIDIDDAYIGIVTSTLTLRMTSSSDINLPYPAQVFIYASGTQVFLKDGRVGEPQPLTTDRVVVDRFEFKKHTTPKARDSVDVVIGVSYNSPNLQKKFSQLIQTAVARVNAATFDSDIVPSSTANNLNLGVLGRTWQTVNGVIFFDGGSVGIGLNPSIDYSLDVNGPFRVNDNAFVSGSSGRGSLNVGTTTPTVNHQLVVTGEGGLRLWPTSARPACDVFNSQNRGLIWFLTGTPDDKLQICMFSGGTFQWVTLATSTP